MVYAVFTRILGTITAIFIAAGQFPLMFTRRQRPAASPRAHRTSPALRTLFLHRDLPIHGGVPQCFLNLARALDPTRIEFHVASFDPPSEEMTQKFRALGIDPQTIGDKGYISPSRNLLALIQTEEIDIVVATTFKAYLCAKIATRRRDVGVVFWFHAIRGAVEGFTRRAIRDYLATRDPLIFVSRAVREAQLPPNHRAPAQVIYNGVQDVSADPGYEPYPPEKRQEFAIPKESLLLAYVAEFIIWKDHATAISAMHELARKNVDAHLLLIGTGQDIETARLMAKAGPAGKRIHFLGPRSDVRQLLPIIDIYIHTSREEGFGLAVVEAMLAARPIVAARSKGGVIELIDPGRTGVLVDPGSPTALADAVISLAADTEKCRQMGHAARASCLEKFDPHQFAGAVSLFLETSFPLAVRRRRMSNPPSGINQNQPICAS